MNVGRIHGPGAGEIATSIRALIAEESLIAGDTLPPIRGLASTLGVNRNTVAAAYAQLATAGIVQARGRGGTLVLGVPTLDAEGASGPSRTINLASGNPDPDLLPDLATTFRKRPFTPALYGADPIDPRLASWALEHLGPDTPTPHRLILAHGAADAVERLLDAHLTRGDAVAVEDPCFLSTIGTLRVHGYRPIAVPVDAEGMTAAGLRSALQRGARAVVCTPRAHNPTGVGLSAARAEELRAIAAERPDVLIIEDDYFFQAATLVYHPLAGPATTHRALVRSVSKTLGPDLRLAFVLADPATAERLATRLNPANTWVSGLIQHAALGLLHDPAALALVTEARNTYVARRHLLAGALADQGLAVIDPGDGLNVWVPLPVAEGPVVDALAARGWAVRAGRAFSLTDDPEPAIRVTVSTLTADQAGAFAADLAEAIGSVDARTEAR